MLTEPPVDALGSAVVGSSPVTVVAVTGVASATATAVGALAVARSVDDCSYFSRIGHHEGSTDSLFSRYCSYSSSTSHSLAPNSPEAPPSAPVPDTWLDTADRPLSLLLEG